MELSLVRPDVNSMYNANYIHVESDMIKIKMNLRILI